MTDAPTFSLPRTDEMILKLGMVIGLALRAAEDDQETATVRFVRQAIHDALNRERSA